MKILFLNYEYPPLGGGAANATKYLLDQYKNKKNIQVDLVTTSANNKSYVEDLGGGICIHYVSINKDTTKLTHQSARDLLVYSYKGYRVATDLMKEKKYDFIHAFFAVPCGVIAQRLSKKFHVPYIVSLRGADVPGFSDRYTQIYPFLVPLIKSVWKGAYAVIANSKKLRTLAHETDAQQKIDIIYNGVDTDIFRPPNTPHNTNQFVILVAARLMRRKGIRFAIEAFAKVKDRNSNKKIKMVIAGGDGDAAHALRQQVQDLYLTKSILFAGHLDRKALIVAYGGADVFVLPSLNEGMSNNMLEALACGLPVIITRTGGSEIIEHRVHGLLVNRESGDAIASALQRLIDNPEQRIAMGASARALAQEMSWQSVADQYEALYYKHNTHS